ncbi:MAG: radical SAM protein [Cyanobacteria bacterium J06592_8]
MSFEVRPLGVQCNLRCQYCYQNIERETAHSTHTYNLDALLDRIHQAEEPFTLFGGEPLLMPIADLEKLFTVGLEKWGENHIQTNATLIRDRHLDLFEKYQVSVGVSIDGPGALNDGRWAGSWEKTRKLTAHAEQAIKSLCQRQIPTYLIITLHRQNATEDKLPILGTWLRYMDQLGVESTRLHLLEVDDAIVDRKYALTPAENLAALLYLETVEQELEQMQLDIFSEMIALLLAKDDEVSCVWRACDPYTTEAVQGIDGEGRSSNCGRINKDGVSFEKAASPGYERYLALYHTPQAFGGCQDCRFFLMCKGQCPGTSLDGDWRNRTTDCTTWKKLYIHLEQRLQTQGKSPLSLHPWRPVVESMMLNAWTEGSNPSIQIALTTLQGNTETSDD